jgi:hypothetical protein
MWQVTLWRAAPLPRSLADSSRFIFRTLRGNSLALVNDRPILDLLKIDPETPLDVSTDGKQLIVAPARPSDRRKKFEAAQASAHRRYGKAFLKLAE